MTKINPIYVGQEAIASLVQYSKDKSIDRFMLVADTNTYRAMGEQVERALRDGGFEVTSIVLTGEEVIADERYLLQVLANAPMTPSTFLAVGSGTLTDITRFVSHRMGRSFISLPTAPSVDGFTSIGAPLVLNRVKQTITSQAPVALFADLQTLADAPPELIAAGYGDMIGKITSLADWKLGSLVWDEPFDESVYKRSETAIKQCISHTDEIGRRSLDGMRHLIEALIESGLCMLDFGSSRPASGAEHHASHYWEMMLLQQNRPALLHGAKVGFALTLVSAQYAKVLAMSRVEMRDRLATAALPDRDAEIAAIREGYGAVADDVIQSHADFLDMTPEQFETIKQRIDERWDDIQQIAANIPPPAELAGYLQQVGGATNGEALGLKAGEVALALQYGHYLRNRFTVMKLSRLLNIPLHQ
jgi:glycerol-1-phosphate dehydrogenase [NAD(P)+]